MNEIILHHYPTSPFAEKMRLVLGATGLAWRSVIIPRIMPKPDVIALTGGYRKTPILQIGADIFCDTSRIAQALDHAASAPPLYPAAHRATAQRTAQWADSVLFQAAVALVFQPSVIAESFPEGPETMRAFVADRMAMRQGATVRRMPADEAQATVESLLVDLDAQLADGRRYLLGEAPTIADVSIYHPLWFLCRLPAWASEIARYEGVARWRTQVAALGHGTSTDLASGDAVDIAKAATPALVEPHSDHPELRPGAKVEVGPTDYGLDATSGDLLLCTRDEIAVRRVDARAGEVIVHFPRQSYQLRAAS
jgi:glutathione S-transferase